MTPHSSSHDPSPSPPTVHQTIHRHRRTPAQHMHAAVFVPRWLCMCRPAVYDVTTPSGGVRVLECCVELRCQGDLCCDCAVPPPIPQHPLPTPPPQLSLLQLPLPLFLQLSPPPITAATTTATTTTAVSLFCYNYHYRLSLLLQPLSLPLPPTAATLTVTAYHCLYYRRYTTCHRRYHRCLFHHTTITATSAATIYPASLT